MALTAPPRFNKSAAAGLLLALASAFAAAAPAIETTNFDPDARGNYAHNPTISRDGRYIAYTDLSTPQDHIMMYDRITGIKARADLTPAGAPSSNGNAGQPVISADGRYVVFASLAKDMGIPAAHSGGYFVYDRIGNTTTTLFTGDIGVGRVAAISSDGRYIAYRVASPPSTNTAIYVRDTVAQTTQLVNATNTFVVNIADRMYISDDGRYLAYRGKASGDTYVNHEMVRHDRLAGTAQLVNVNSAGERESLPRGSSYISMSADGNFFSFTSTSPNLWPGDSAASADVFVRDIKAGTTTRLSYPISTTANSGVYGSSISADGRFVVFTGWLVPGGANGLHQYDRATKIARRVVSTNRIGAPIISASGRYAVYDCSLQSQSTNPLICTTDFAAPFALSLSTNTVEVTEGGDSVTYTAVLDQMPDADVKVDVNPDAQLTVARAQLTFTPSNWNTPQTISVQALPNTIVQGAHSGLVQHVVTSTDPQYTGVPAASVSATILDGVIPVIVLPGASAPAPELLLSGSAAPGSTILISAGRSDDPAIISVSAQADAQGNWSAVLTQLAPGSYQLQAVANGIQSAVYMIEITQAPRD